MTTNSHTPTQQRRINRDIEEREMAKGGEKELEERCEIILAIEELSLLKNEEEEKKLSTLAFLHLSNLLLQVLGKIITLSLSLSEFDTAILHKNIHNEQVQKEINQEAHHQQHI